MKRVDPFQLARPERKVTTRLFDSDGAEVEISFRKPDAADMNRAAEIAYRLTKDFILGYPEEGTPAADFFDGIEVTESFFQLCASAEVMQPPDARAYNAIDFAILMDRLPTDGPRIAAFVREMQIDWRTSSGNSRGVPTGSRAAEHSTSPTSTSNSVSETTSSSTRSTPGSENSAGAAERTPART